MRPFVIDRYTPDVAPGLTTPLRFSRRSGPAAGFRATVSDANMTPLRSGYWHRVKVRQLNDDGTTTDVTGADGLRDLGYGTTSTSYSRTGRYFVNAMACGPLSRDATRGCGPISSERRVSTFIPVRP